MSETTKSWWESKTIWGAGLVLASTVLGIFGYDFSGADQALIAEYANDMIVTVGGVIAIYGRVVASKALK